MDNFLSFFLSNHLGPNLLCIIILAISFRRSLLELPEKYKEIKTENDKYDFTYELFAYIIIDAVLILFIILDFIQPTEILFKFIYFILSLIVIISVIYVDISDTNENNK